MMTRRLIAPYIGAVLVCSVASAQFFNPALYFPVPARGDTWGSCGSGIILSNANRTATNATGTNAWRSCHGTPTSYSTGKHYFEVSTDNESTSFGFIAGIMNASGPTTNFSGSDTNSVGLQRVGPGVATKYYNNVGTAGFPNCGTASAHLGQHIGYAIDVGNKLWCTNDGVNWNTGGSDSPVAPSGGIDISGISGAVFPAISLFGGPLNDDQGSLFTTTEGIVFPIPSGYTIWLP